MRDIELSRYVSWTVVRINQDGISEPSLDQIQSMLHQEVLHQPSNLLMCFGPSIYPFSRMLALVIYAKRLVEKAGFRLAIVTPNHLFVNVLRQTKLDHAVEFHCSEEDVLRGIPARLDDVVPA